MNWQKYFAEPICGLLLALTLLSLITFAFFGATWMTGILLSPGDIRWWLQFNFIATVTLCVASLCSVVFV